MASLRRWSTFAEGNKPPVQIAEDGSSAPITDFAKKAGPRGRADAFVGTNVFVLFDTSNYMYRGFVYASDAIADFVRGLDRADSVAVYTYKPQSDARRAAEPRSATTRFSGLRKAVAGDDSALYNCAAADFARRGHAFPAARW